MSRPAATDSPGSAAVTPASTTVAVLGPGGVGGFLAAALDRGGMRVTVLARESTAASIERDGLAVDSVRLGAFRARPQAVCVLEETVDVLMVATKASGLEAALARVQAQPRLVVPLLNGLDHLAVLRARFGPAAVAASIRIESDRPRPGVIVQTSAFLRIDLASDDPRRRPMLAALAEQLEAARVPARVLDSEAQVIWSKLVRLNALACTTSAADLLLGPILADPGWRRLLYGAIDEGAAVARAEGAEVDPLHTRRELDEAHPTLGSSMARDLATGRPAELDAIAGAVLRAARGHGLACPCIERLVGLIVTRRGVASPSVPRAG